MKEKREKSLVSPNKPQGNGLVSHSQSHKPQGNGLVSHSQSHKPQGNGLPSVRQSHKPQGNGLPSVRQSHNPEKARAYAFLLLKFRLRSENELKQRLKQKGFSEESAGAAVSFLKDKEFIDDRVFARGWVASRVRRLFGLRRIRQELVQKGIDKEIIENSLSQVKEDYNESRIVSRLAQQRFSKLKGIEPLKPQGNGLASNSQSHKAKARVYAYLIRRGFASDIVSDIVKRL